jgi:hypothetical protein
MLHADSTPNHEKTYQNTKKYVSRAKRVKNWYEGFPTKFTGSTQNSEKIIDRPNYPMQMKKMSQKTTYLVL